MRDSTEALSTVTYEITILWLLYLCAPLGFSLTELPPRSYSKWLPKAWLGCVDIRVRVKGVNTYTYIRHKTSGLPTIFQEHVREIVHIIQSGYNCSCEGSKSNAAK